MKKLTLSLIALSLSTSVFANSTANIVERPLTLTDGELLLAGALVYGQEFNDDNKWRFMPQIAYGLTDDLMVSLGEIRYKFLSRLNNKDGLELTAGISYAGNLEVAGQDDTNGGQFDITGQYVFSPDTALTFGVGYVHWEEDSSDDKAEMRYSIGVKQRIVDDITLLAGYTYRDLKDFTKSAVNHASLGINYHYTQAIDVGLFGFYSDFDPAENGYIRDEALEKGVGAYLTYRF